MKRIATLLCLTHLLASPIAHGAQKRLIAWKVASVGNSFITNYDVEQFIEQTQVSDSLKTALFKKAEGDFSKYQELKREITKKNFKKSAGTLIYAKIMQQDHQINHGRNRVAFKVSEDTFYDAVQENETKVLRTLLDEGIGIVKSRERFGQFLINQNYPHMAQESATDVYWRWYEDQKGRIKTELLLKEVKNYEAYIALRNQKYYHADFMGLQDRYDSIKNDIQEKINNKKISHKSLMSLLNANKDWNIVLKKISNSQVDSALLKEYKTDLSLQKRANDILSTISNSDWTKITSYHDKIDSLIEKGYSINDLNSMAKSYTEAYIADKSKFSSYMMGLIAKLAVVTKESSTQEEIKSLAKEINTELKAHLIDFNSNLSSLNIDKTLDKALEIELLKGIQYEKLSEVEKAIADLSIFSIKFQVKKHSFENTLPVRVEFSKYTDPKTFSALSDLLKYEWMQSEFKEYAKSKLIYKTEYMTIRTGEHEYLTPEEKRELIFGEEYR